MREEYKINCYDDNLNRYYITQRGSSRYIGKEGTDMSAGELLSNRHWIKSHKDARRVIDKLVGKCVYIGGE